MEKDSKEYSYDVALSFLAQDEPLAKTIANKLKDKLKVFVYSEQQKEIAGKDGVETFTTIFRNDSRIVVILFRDGWGRTKWTRVEEEAIKDRFLNTGWDFLKVILLEPPKRPIWLPESKMWFDINTFGVDEAVGVIKAQVLQKGGKITEESLIDQSKRHKEELEILQKKKQFLDSKDGYDAAQNCFRDLFKIFKENAEKLSIEIEVPLKIEDNYNTLKISGFGLHLKVEMGLHYKNSAKDSQLDIKLFEIDRSPERRHAPPFYREIVGALYTFDVNSLHQFGWSSISEQKFFYGSEKIVEFWLKKIDIKVHNIKKHHMEN